MSNKIEYFSRNNPYARLVLGLHQLLGALIGMIMLLLTDDINLVVACILSAPLVLSAYAGYLIWNNRSNAIFYSSLNYFLQCLDFQLDGLISFRYNLPLSAILGFNFTHEILEMNIYILPSIQFFFLTEIDDLFAVNLVALLLLIFLSMEKGINLRYLNLDKNYGV